MKKKTLKKLKKISQQYQAKNSITSTAQNITKRNNRRAIFLALVILYCSSLILYVTIVYVSENRNNPTEESSIKVDSPLLYEDDQQMFGVASYYDYVLDSGWSSIGHNVCATRDYERFSRVRVTNTDNGKHVDCTVTDYGPDYSVFPERIVDLSSHAFSQIESTKMGIANVSVKQIE